MIEKCYVFLKQLYSNFKDDNIIKFNQNGCVFKLYDECNITRDRVTLELNKITSDMKKEGIEVGHITCHCFRHTFATRAIEQGIPPQVLKTILGHSSLAMTMDLYSHVLPNTKLEEMEKLANHIVILKSAGLSSKGSHNSMEADPGLKS